MTPVPVAARLGDLTAPGLPGGLQAYTAGSMPVARIYSFFVDQYAAGLTTGAVKG